MQHLVKYLNGILIWEHNDESAHFKSLCSFLMLAYVRIAEIVITLSKKGKTLILPKYLSLRTILEDVRPFYVFYLLLTNVFVL